MFGKHWLWITLGLLLWWTGVARAQVSMTPDPINAGNVLVGASGSADGILHSTTNGVSADVVLSSTCTGTGTGMFALSSGGGATTGLNLNTDKTITATYTPLTRGLRECTVNVTDSNMVATPMSFKVRGTGIAPVVSTNLGATYNFGAVRYNNAVTPHTATVSLVISNSGDAGTTLNVSNVSVSNTQDFSVSGTLPAVLGTGASATFVITFDPLAAGASSA
ncbi:MAG TPA: choice-of-anchor D domain-containing protein, partial [Kofleriaceae bacterium]